MPNLTRTLALSLFLLPSCGGGDDAGDDASSPDASTTGDTTVEGWWSLTFAGAPCDLAPSVTVTFYFEEVDVFAHVEWPEHDGFTYELASDVTTADILLTYAPSGTVVEQVDASLVDDGVVAPRATLTYRTLTKGSADLCTIGPIEPTVARTAP